jgi:hypothetical protein
LLRKLPNTTLYIIQMKNETEKELKGSHPLFFSSNRA